MSTECSDFKLDEKTKKALLDAFKKYPELLRDLDNAIGGCEARTRRMKVLEERKKFLMQQNQRLRAQTEANISSRPGTGRGASSSTTLDEFDEATPSTGSKVTSGWRQSRFFYDGPSARGDVVALFPEGRLFRITNGKQIYFYNDSLLYRMHVTYAFPQHVKVLPGEASRWIKRLSCDFGQVEMILDPLQTSLLCCSAIDNATDMSYEQLITPEMESELKYQGELSEKVELKLSEILSMCPPWMGQPEKHRRRWTTINEHAVDACVKSLHPFVDSLFPPCRASLYRRGTDQIYIPPLIWKRPREYLPPGSDIRLFRGPLAFREIGSHAQFDNHFFTSTLRALTSLNDKCIKELFRHPESAKKGKLERLLGIFRVSLCIAGWWRSVVIDSYVPSTTSCPLFTHDTTDLRNTWVLILEKALAKSCGSYSALLSCPSSSFVGMLTGSPYCSLECVWPTSKDCSKFLEFLRSKKSLLQNSTTNNRLRVFLETFSMAETFERRGLPSLYEKFGLRTRETILCTGIEVIGGASLLHLHPNGAIKSSEWLGVWESEEKKWTKEVTELVVGLDAKNTIWMDITDVHRFFSGGFASYDPSGMDELRVKGKFTSKGAPSIGIKVQVTSKTSILISLVQPSCIRRPIGFAVYCDGTGDDQKHFAGASCSKPCMPDLEPQGKLHCGDQVSTICTLLPENGVYYFVPCAEEVEAATPWTLGIFCEEYSLTSTEIELSFVSPPENLTYFEGSADFNALKGSDEIDAEYQLRSETMHVTYNRRKRL